MRVAQESPVGDMAACELRRNGRESHEARRRIVGHLRSGRIPVGSILAASWLGMAPHIDHFLLHSERRGTSGPPSSRCDREFASGRHSSVTIGDGAHHGTKTRSCSVPPRNCCTTAMTCARVRRWPRRTRPTSRTCSSSCRWRTARGSSARLRPEQAGDVLSELDDATLLELVALAGRRRGLTHPRPRCRRSTPPRSGTSCPKEHAEKILDLMERRNPRKSRRSSNTPRTPRGARCRRHRGGAHVDGRGGDPAHQEDRDGGAPVRRLRGGRSRTSHRPRASAPASFCESAQYDPGILEKTS